MRYLTIILLLIVRISFAENVKFFFEGDSITAGNLLTNIGHNFQFDLATNVAWDSWFTNRVSLLTNVSVSGSHLTDVYSRFTASIKNQLAGAGTNNYEFVLVGANDIFDGDPGATGNGLGWFQSLTNYWLMARTNGLKVVASTVTPASRLNGTQDATRVSINSFISAASGSWDYLCDMSSVVPLSCGACYTDSVHPSDGGHLLMASNINWTLSQTISKSTLNINGFIQVGSGVTIIFGQ